eukprot:403372445
MEQSGMMVDDNDDIIPIIKEEKSKVIIITGFLGAGKTTLIESILKQPVLNKKVAVIQNEFSAKMGLESSLMKDQNGEDIQDFYEMPNGCICCAAKDDLILTLDTLLEKKPELEYILVETNGLADPSQVIQTFWVDDGLCSKIVLHQTIGVIDTVNFETKMQNHALVKNEDEPAQFSESDLLLRQLIYADKILLNKIDLIQEDKKDGLLKSIREKVKVLNPQADLQESSYSQTGLEFLTEKNVNNDFRNQDKFEQQNCCALDTHDHNHCDSQDHSHDHKQKHHHDHSAVENIQSIYINADFQTLINFDKFEKLMGELLWEDMDDMSIMRCKGTFVAINKDQESNLWEYMLQGVMNTFELREIQNYELINHAQVYKHRFLFIGKNLNEQKLNLLIKKCYDDQNQ